MRTTFSLRIPVWNVSDLNGYTPKTTFWQDFWIAAAYGTDAVQDTYNRAMKEWKDNYIYMTELALVLNHMGCLFYKKNDTITLARLFFQLDEQHTDWCYENLKGDELAYFMQVID